MQHTFLASSGKHGRRNNELLSMGVDQCWLTESPCGSRPSSIATEPYISNSFLSPTALSTDTRSLCDGDCVDSSPIAADRLYRPHEREAVAMAALCLHSSPDDSIDGPLDISLFAGTSSICGTVSSETKERGSVDQQTVCLPIAQAIDAAIEIDDGLHVLYDYGSAGGVFLGHRRARVKHNAGYVVTDGKLVWFGDVSFWYRVLDDPRRSKSPTPPWRDMHATDIAPGMQSSFPHGKILGDTMQSDACANAPPSHPPPSSPLASTMAGTREQPLSGPRPVMLRREDRANRPRAARLRREVATADISHSPGPRLQQSPVLTSPPGGPLFLLAHGSPDDVASYPGSPQEADHEFAFSTMLDNSPKYGSDGENSIPVDTEPMSPRSDNTQGYCPCSSPPRLEYAASPSPPRVQLASVHSSLRIEDLRMDGDASILASGSDDDDECQSLASRAPTEILSACNSPSPEPEMRPEAPPTQPVSPSRLPPQHLTSGSRNSSFGDALLGRRQSAEQNAQHAGNTQMAKTPVDSASDSAIAYFPQPSALVCAPSRVILVGPHTTGPSCSQQMVLPRYPYDVEGMESFLRSATQNTSPTQPDTESVDGLDGNQLSVLSVEGSDFSLTFISPPPATQLPSSGLCVVKTGSSRMSVDSNGTASSKDKSPALTTAQSSVSLDQAPIATPASGNTRLLATNPKRHRHSIDNYTDEEEDDDEERVIVSETPAKRNSAGHPASRSGSRLSTPSTSTLSLSTSSAVIATSVRNSQRFNTPTYMSSRVRYSRHTPLNLKPSTLLHAPPPPPLRMDTTPLRTPLTRVSHGRSSASTSNYPSLPPTAPLAYSAKSAGIEASRPHFGRIPTSSSNDGFPDDTPGSLLGTQGVNRANRGHRRYTQGSGTPLTAVNQSHSPLMYPHATEPMTPVQTYQPVMAGVLESPMSIDSPTTAYTRPPAPTECAGPPTNVDDTLLSSSPDLPHPRALIESIIAGATAESLERTKSGVEQPCTDLIPTRNEADEALFNPLVDPVSSAPTSSKTAPVEDRELDVDATQLDHEDSIVPEKPPPRIHLRVPTKSTTSPVSSAATSTNDVLADVEPSAAQQPAAANGWINMDNAQSRGKPPKSTRATPAPSRGQGKARGRGGNNGSDVQASSSRAPLATTTLSPAGSRNNTLQDSLRKLPGMQGSKRTGLSASRRTPVSGKKKLPTPILAKGTQSASESPTPKVLGVAARASTATTTHVSPVILPTTLSATNEATLLEPMDVKPRIYGGKQRASGGRVSHRNLDLAQTTPTKAMLPTLPPKRKNTDSGGGAAIVSAARLTRQNSSTSDTCGIRMVAITGFLGDDLDQAVRKLEAHGLTITDNPLLADVCVRQGKLGRTLKVLCALARGIPVVSPDWVSDLSSMALRTRSTSPHKTPATLAQRHLLTDRATEREWGFTLAETLQKARDMSGQLLAGYCVYVTPNVARPDPACLSVMVKSAGGFVLNDFGRLEERILRGEENIQPDPHLNRSVSATTAPDLDGSGTPTLSTAECMLAGELSESSTEPDNDSDEDWGAEKTRSRRTSTGGIIGNSVSGSHRRRKTLPKLAKIEYESSDEDTRRFKLKSEPSMIFVPPNIGSAATTPVRNRGASESPSVRQRLSANNKRRRIQESPSISATAMHFALGGCDAGPATVAFDPQCSRQDMAILLTARKSELGIPADAQLLVVSANTELAVRKMWETHGAVVIEPELIIQSIIHCSRQF